MVVVIDSQDAIPDNHVLTRKGDDALDDVFITTTDDIVRIFKDNNLATLRDIGLVLELRPGDGQAVDDQAVACVERGLHARAADVEGAKDECVDNQGADEDAENKNQNAHDVFEERVAL